MENSLKGLLLAAGTIITCIIISLGFYIAREAKDTAATGAGQINKLNAEFADNSKTIYDGTEVSGSEVLNVIRKFQGEPFGVFVTTKKDTKGSYYGYVFDNEDGELGAVSGEDVLLAKKESEEQYINPNARFLGTIVRDVNNTITGLTFNQQ
jgi:hypothetical protein